MKRFRYFDILRAASCCLIVYYHIGTGIRDWLPDRMPALPQLIGANLHVAELAVTIFFMLSGAGLALSVRGKTMQRVSDFYLRRFRRLMLPFYLTYAAFFLIRLFWHLADHSPLFPAGIPAWYFLFTLLGMDGLLTYYGIPTFYLGVGEWFLGCLILLYLLFPLLHRLMSRHPKLFGLGIAAIFAVSCMLFPDVNAFPFRLSEFAAGMIIGAYCPLFPRRTLLLSVPALLFLVFWPELLPGHWALKNFIAVLAFWSAASAAEPWLSRFRMSWLAMISGFSYEVFLVHHAVISWISHLWAVRITQDSLLLLILAETISILLAAAALHRTVGLCSRLFPASRT